MKEFDYIIIGGGCAGLSLAYELDSHQKLENKTLAIVEPRDEYKRDKTWSFWKVSPHNFDDCIKKSWDNFTINIPGHLKHIDCKNMPYQTIDSGLFYQKIIDKLKQKNLENYRNSGKIYVSSLEKVIETFLSIFDLIKLVIMDKNDNHIQHDHFLILNENPIHKLKIVQHNHHQLLYNQILSFRFNSS